MAYKPSLRYASHLPVLMQAVRRTSGDVLELGMGIFSTPVLHWMCVGDERRLVSYDNDPWAVKWAKGYKYERDGHEIHYVKSWDEAEIEEEWDVVLVDHSPSERRVVEIRRLADLAKHIVIHDSNGRYRRYYHYDTIFHLFKSQLNFDYVEPSTTVLSNLVELDGFWDGTRRWQREWPYHIHPGMDHIYRY
jgi:hypothetical protein